MTTLCTRKRLWLLALCLVVHGLSFSGPELWETPMGCILSQRPNWPRRYRKWRKVETDFHKLVSAAVPDGRTLMCQGLSSAVQSYKNTENEQTTATCHGVNRTVCWDRGQHRRNHTLMVWLFPQLKLWCQILEKKVELVVRRTRHRVCPPGNPLLARLWLLSFG